MSSAQLARANRPRPFLLQSVPCRLHKRSVHRANAAACGCARHICNSPVLREVMEGGFNGKPAARLYRFASVRAFIISSVARCRAGAAHWDRLLAQLQGCKRAARTRACAPFRALSECGRGYPERVGVHARTTPRVCLGQPLTALSCEARVHAPPAFCRHRKVLRKFFSK